MAISMGQNCMRQFPTVGSKRINTAVGNRPENEPVSAFFTPRMKIISFKNQWVNRSNPDRRI
jgi:hypothetical protein